MPLWFMLTGNDPNSLNKTFHKFINDHSLPAGVALWRWKRSCWICSPEKFRYDILSAFTRFSVIEFSSAPSPDDLEFIYGDNTSLSPPSGEHSNLPGK
jgi:hypothetical protein